MAQERAARVSGVEIETQMKFGTVAYLPPRGKLFSDAFAANIGQFKSRYPIYFISDDGNWKPSRLIDDPEKIGTRPKWAINNWLFLKSLQLARDVGLEYMIYLEADSRVGCDDWDGALLDEMFARYPSGIDCAGSPVCWDVTSGGREFAKRVIEDACEYQKAGGLPASFHGGKHPHDTSGSCYYPNGSCAIYRMQDMLKLFAGFDRDIIGNARILQPWDMEIGRRLWFNYGPNCVSHVGWLAKAYSGFGNSITTEAERWQMLKDGRKVAVHQIKEG